MEPLKSNASADRWPVPLDRRRGGISLKQTDARMDNKPPEGFGMDQRNQASYNKAMIFNEFTIFPA
jgi:hypothetical protein